MSAIVELPRTRLFKVNLAMWCIALGSVFISCRALHSLGLEIRLAEPWKIFSFIALTLILTTMFYVVKKDERIFYFGSILSQAIVVALFIDMFQYLGPCLHFDFIDERLVALDGMLGLRWMDFINWANVSLSPAAIGFLSFSYFVFAFEIVVMICVLFALEKSTHAQRFVLAMYVCGLACGVISALYPSLPTYVFYNIDAAKYPHFHFIYADEFRTIMGIRDHTILSLKIPNIGIITFPSYHATMAVLLMYSGMPFRRTRLLIIPLNISMLFATPIFGGHYFIDVMAGSGIAVAAILAAKWILPDRPRHAAFIACKNASP